MVHSPSSEATGLLRTWCDGDEVAKQINWQDRAHFLAVGAGVARRILMDRASTRDCPEREGAVRRAEIDKALLLSAEPGPMVSRLDEALQELPTFDSRKAQVIAMRSYGRLTTAQIAPVLRTSLQSVQRDRNLAKSWLVRQVNREEADGA